MAAHATPLEALLMNPAFDGEVMLAEPMSAHTTYRIGGPARWFVRADSLSALTGLLDACANQRMSWAMVGRGSNLLVADSGFDGVVVTLGRDFRAFRVQEDGLSISAGAGVLLSAVVQEAFKRSLAGLEFAVGTPGNLGGALRMNAGSADEYIGSRVVSVTVYTPGVGMRKLQASDVKWGYRATSFALDDVILECELALEGADPFFIRGKMEANLKRRKASQPLDLPSCGSVFRNPPGESAAKLIDKAGLKGTKCGGAQVSNKHANFIVNTGGASAADVRQLIDTVKARVFESYGIQLTTEVRFLGFR
ncbi:UDP-N-acetylmuramate dehydrogenase [Adlercreutzia sp. ZJ304]|uniref:UDP-N-acetylmuramate dehydrogenase n=1 Tax=Adlercreutzia sp. ZJ304 TaxID=2709791 RepID=UPI001F14DB9D|nr:UDP-N-acetylmuramate dehydrogenase [Adlercreutzia sp. ZJ304]